METGPSERIIAKTFPELLSDTSPQIEEDQHTTSRKVIMKLQCSKEKGDLKHIWRKKSLTVRKDLACFCDPELVSVAQFLWMLESHHTCYSSPPRCG